MKIYELLDSPEKWTQGRGAASDLGQSVAATNPSAVCWCLAGAAARCYPGGRDPVFEKLRRHFGSWLGVFDWNDAHDRTYEDVVALVKELDV